MTSAPYLYDQIKLSDSTQGVVKYIGEVEGEAGTMFGLEMLPYYGGHDSADTNGTIGKQTYFTCTDNEKIGRFVTEDEIEEVIEPSTHDLDLAGDAPQFTVGDRCFISKKNCNAMVHYVGIPKFARDPKIFIGLELDEPVGNCNGTLAGCTYFECEDKYGIYQVPKNVTLAQEEVNVDIEQVDYDKVEEEEKERAERERIAREERQQQQAEQREREERYQQQQQEAEAKRKALEAEQKRRLQLEQDEEERERIRLMQAEERQKATERQAQAKKEQEERERKWRQEQQRKEEIQRQEREQQQAIRRAREKQQEQQQQQDDYKAFVPVAYGVLDAPKLEPRTVRDGNVETIYPTYMTNFCVKARTHHKLNNYKTINYSSRKFQMDDQLVQNKLEELHKAHVADRGHFILDGDKRFAYTLMTKPHEWRAATRVNTDDISEAKACLDFIEQNTQKAVANVDRIQKFDWNKNFQALVSSIRKANQ